MYGLNGRESWSPSLHRCRCWGDVNRVCTWGLHIPSYESKLSRTNCPREVSLYICVCVHTCTRVYAKVHTHTYNIENAYVVYMITFFTQEYHTFHIEHTELPHI